ncbi:hypothetical protein [Rubrivirga sp. IMCC45206]|uniref:hypothetical protein n=1 Tax=Rubrivirga sp. IMCC45206 TaxID=3391614 RepID=UPI00398FB195
MTRSPSRLTILPFALLAVFTVFLAIPATRDAAQWMLAENRPVELLSFVFLMVGGVLGLRLAAQLRRRGERGWTVAFYALFSLGLLAIGAEEVAWGQWFVGFETPEAIAEVNTQGELTLHNHKALKDHLEIFPLLFGLAGLVGVWVRRFPGWSRVAAPAALLPWFALIAVVSAVDFLQDWVVIQAQFDELVNALDELVEMFVALAGLLFVRFNAARLLPATPADAIRQRGATPEPAGDRWGSIRRPRRGARQRVA